ncbi:MAG: dockerin type I repeat-containing protein [Ruminococcus sp.]|nr:dockerin type I repeat-containing protein [Ruminococcus sp.]
MRSFTKKLVSLLTAACICAAGAVPMNASATIVGDVNNDGAVSLLDVTALNKYLLGKVELVSYDAADATGNYVINVVDSLVIQKYVIGTIYSLPYNVVGE